jgi:hypothetical protein
MGANSSKAEPSAEKQRADPSMRVVTGAAAAPAQPPRKNFGAYGCAVGLAIQANTKQQQLREASAKQQQQAVAPTS